MSWEPRKVIDDNRLAWREKYHSVAYFLEKDAKKIIDSWVAEGTFEQNEKKLRRQNIGANIVRLLTHTNAPACKDFALLCMRHIADLDIETVHTVFPTNGGDGDDGAQFWTFGPYILEALKEDRFLNKETNDDYQDFLKVLIWMKSRKRTGNWGYDAVYPGIGDLRREVHNLYLPRDGFHPIHKFVSKVSTHIAKYLANTYVDKKLLENDETRPRRLTDNKLD